MWMPELIDGAAFATESAFVEWLRNWDWDWTDLWQWVWGIASYHITANGIWGYLGVFLTIYVLAYGWEVTRPFVNLTNAFLFRAIAGAVTTVIAVVGGGSLARAKDLFVSMARRLANWLKEQGNGRG